MRSERCDGVVGFKRRDRRVDLSRVGGREGKGRRDRGGSSKGHTGGERGAQSKSKSKGTYGIRGCVLGDEGGRRGGTRGM